MSMTRGPIVPPITGSSTDFPVALSVSVIVPVTILFPSIAPPLPLYPLAVAGFGQENRLPEGDWQTRALSRQPRLGNVADPSQAFFAPEKAHHFENAE